jgi:hypothetical protein
MAFPPDDQWFWKLIEQQKQFEKLFDPIPEWIKQQQKLIDNLNPMSLLQNEHCYEGYHDSLAVFLPFSHQRG